MIETSAVVAITARLYSMRATLFASAHQTSTSVHHIATIMQFIHTTLPYDSNGSELLWVNATYFPRLSKWFDAGGISISDSVIWWAFGSGGIVQ